MADIVTLAQSVAGLVRAVLAETPTRNQVDALVKQAGELKDAMQVITKNRNALQSPGAQLTRARNRLRDKVPLPSADAPPAPRPPAAAAGEDVEPRDKMALADFFTDVSGALIDAQKALNDQSLEYIAGLEDPRLVQAARAYFAIPTVRAEMKVGFDHRGSEKLNVILFSREREKRNFGESTVTFDLVAAPPPPGEEPLLGELVVATPWFLVLGAERAEVLKAVRALGKANRIKEPSKTFDNAEPLALVLRRDDPTSGRYLVIWPAHRVTDDFKIHAQGLLVVPLERADDGTIELDGEATFAEGGKTHLATSPQAQHDPRDVVNLSDALNQVTLILNDWIDSVRAPRPPG